jgi:hypothetical protein
MVIPCIQFVVANGHRAGMALDLTSNLATALFDLD